MQLIRRKLPENSPAGALIRRFGSFDLDNGPWVAGGAARRAFMDVALNKGDIDIFPASLAQWQQVDASVHAFAPSKHTSSTNRAGTKTYSYYADSLRSLLADDGAISADSLPLSVQVVSTPFRATVEDLLASFDYTVSQFATDGHEVIFTEQAARDLDQRTLRLAGPFRRKNTCVARMMKYLRYGFTPVPGLTAEVLGLNEDKVHYSSSGTLWAEFDNDY